MGVQGNPALPVRNAERQTNSACDGMLAHFCPEKGELSSALQGSSGLRNLLQVRLRAAALLFLGGLVAFLLRRLLFRPPAAWADPSILVFQLGILVLLCGISTLLWLRQLSLRQLRGLELVLFGAQGVFFAWLQYHMGCWAAAQDDRVYLQAFVAESSIPWIVLVQIYGLFIPNTWKRAAGMISAMVAVPLAITLVIASRENAAAAWLMHEGAVSVMVLWVGIPAVAAVYGSYRIRVLSDEALNARQLGAYTLRQRLGAGGMGEVYLAEHHLLKRPAAIKLIKGAQAQDPQALARFESEVRASAELTHPHTIEIYDYGRTDDGTFYYVMEFLKGLSLQDLVDRYGPLPPERAIHLLRQVCGALGEAHARGMIHRDIKPGNIFAAQRGGIPDFVKLLDFGLVKDLGPAPDQMKLTLYGAVIGSPLFAAPESVTGNEADARSDVYSLGATAYFLLTGRPVFDGTQPLKVLYAHANEPPVPPSTYQPNLPRDLEAVVLRCLAKEPGDRFQDVAALDAALAACESPRRPWTATQARGWWENRDRNLAETPVPESQLAATTIVIAGH